MRARVAVLADIHGNRIALEAVLRDADALGVDDVVVAGDVCGFGPEPDASLDILLERGARMIRGNHEADYVVGYDSPARPEEWREGPRYASLLWNMQRLGPGRRAILAQLPDRILIADGAAVHHGSPRGNRDGIYPWTSAEEMAGAFAHEDRALSFIGHTHRAFDAHLPIGKRFVNVGSVGLPLDGTEARYALAHVDGGAATAWRIEIRRVTFDIEAAIGAFAAQDGAVPVEFREMLARTMRTGRDYLGPGLRFARSWPDGQFLDAIRAYLGQAR